MEEFNENLIINTDKASEPPSDEQKRSKNLDDYIAKLKEANDYSDSYNVSLEQFSGPIDLLLHLVKAAKINIEDIFISHITEQYLSYMSQVENLDLEKASDFIEIAAILIEIKSKTLLPGAVEDEETLSAKRELIQKVEEYKLYKEASAKIKEKEVIGSYFKPSSALPDAQIVLKDMTMEGLMRALNKLFLKMEKRAATAPQRKIVLDRFTVAEKISHIKDILLFRDEVNFFELFDSDYTKSEIITTFLALLELLKMQFCQAIQKEVFGEITLKKSETAGVDEADFE